MDQLIRSGRRLLEYQRKVATTNIIEVDPALKEKYRLTPKKAKAFRNAIANGNIPIGPRPDHSQPITDKRPHTLDTDKVTMERTAKGNGHH